MPIIPGMRELAEDLVRSRARILQVGWGLVAASLAVMLVALATGAELLWLTVAVLAMLAAASVAVLPPLESGEEPDEGPRLLIDAVREMGEAIRHRRAA